MTRKVDAGQRSTGVDAVRVLGIIAVVAGHSFNDEAVHHWTYTWHVPLFFILSGYFWQDGRRSLRDEARQRFRTLAVPYATCMSLIFVVVAQKEAANGGAANLLGLALHVAAGGRYIGAPWSAFWFISAMFAAVMVYRMLDTIPFWRRGALLLLVMSSGYAFGQHYAAIPLGLGIGIASTFYVWSGQAIRRCSVGIRLPGTVGLATLGAAGVRIVAMPRAMDLMQGDFGTQSSPPWWPSPSQGASSCCARWRSDNARHGWPVASQDWLGLGSASSCCTR